MVDSKLLYPRHFPIEYENGNLSEICIVQQIMTTLLELDQFFFYIFKCSQIVKFNENFQNFY